MSTNTQQNLQTILVGKLTALLGGDTPATSLFVGVFTSNQTEPSGYPICYVVPKRQEGKITDTHRNERVWEFSVVIHFQLSEGDNEGDQETALNDAVDRVVAMFDRDPMLYDNGGVAQCSKVEVAPAFIERVNQDAAVLRALLTVRVHDLVPRY